VATPESLGCFTADSSLVEIPARIHDDAPLFCSYDQHPCCFLTKWDSNSSRFLITPYVWIFAPPQ